MLSDEEKKALKVVNNRTERLIEELKIEEEDLIDEPKIAYLITQIEANKKLVNLIEKQSKEIEELKEEKYGLEEEVQIQAKQLIEIDGNYISKEESERKRRKAYIKGTNDAHELCNKKWEDKIKAKIEESENKIKKIRNKKLINEPEDTIVITRYAHYISVLQLLLEKE